MDFKGGELVNKVYRGEIDGAITGDYVETIYSMSFIHRFLCCNNYN